MSLLMWIVRAPLGAGEAPEAVIQSPPLTPTAIAGCEAYTPGNLGSWDELASLPARGRSPTRSACIPSLIT